MFHETVRLKQSTYYGLTNALAGTGTVSLTTNRAIGSYSADFTGSSRASPDLTINGTSFTVSLWMFRTMYNNWHSILSQGPFRVLCAIYIYHIVDSTVALMKQCQYR
jgi:hypothetical protein